MKKMMILTLIVSVAFISCKNEKPKDTVDSAVITEVKPLLMELILQLLIVQF